MLDLQSWACWSDENEYCSEERVNDFFTHSVVLFKLTIPTLDPLLFHILLT